MNHRLKALLGATGIALTAAACTQYPTETPQFHRRAQPAADVTIMGGQNHLLTERSRMVFFPTSESEVSLNDRDAIHEFIAETKNLPGVEYEVIGRADSTGSVEPNEVLAEKRVRAVRDAMVEAGAPRASIIGSFYGERKPLADESVDGGKSMNRSVLIRAIPQLD